MNSSGADRTMKQPTFASVAWEKKGKITRRERFLAEMDVVIPWSRLLALIEPHYPKAGNGTQPKPMEQMLRIYFMQNWFNLSDPQAEDSLYDIESMRRFAGIVHSVSTTAANVSDIAQMPELLHGEEREVFGDQAYWSEAHRQAALAKGIRYRVNRRSRHLSEHQRFINRRRSASRARVEHV